jgi:hypothetical protein
MNEKLINFQALHLTKFLMYSADLNMGTISGKTLFKVIFSFLPGIGKHFIGNSLCSTNIHILHLFLINNVSYKPLKKKSRESDLENEGARGLGPRFLPKYQETPCPERHKMVGDVRRCIT